MRVIDLLVKIANGEEVPKKFRFAGQIFEKQDNYIKDEEGDSIFDSICTDFSNINEEVEIIEEDKKIEKIGTIYFDETQTEAILHKKIDEIIDYLEKNK